MEMECEGSMRGIGVWNQQEHDGARGAEEEEVGEEECRRSMGAWCV